MKLSNVYISSNSFRLPKAQVASELYNALAGLTAGDLTLTTEKFTVNNSQRTSTVYKLDLHPKAKDIEFMPKKSDSKVMRPDVIASAICAQELVVNISKEFLPKNDISFYMSNGFCLDRLSANINEMSSKYIKPDVEENISEEDFIIKQNQSLDRFTPPLFVLNALTNAAQSFASQYGEFRGDNTTQGGTSQSSFYSLSEACMDIENSNTDTAVVGASNGAGVYSGASNQTRVKGNLFESEASSFLLLESSESLKKRSGNAIVKITSIKDSKVIPSLFKRKKLDVSTKFLNENKISEHCIFSGCFSNEEHGSFSSEVDQIWKNTYSLFSTWGNSGVAQNFLDITCGIEIMKRKGLQNIDCYNRDIFGRESLISLEVCNE